MTQTQTIKDLYGRIIGYVEEDSNGDKTAYDFYRRVVGRYKKNLNATQDFYGRIVAQGDITVSQVMNTNPNHV